MEEESLEKSNEAVIAVLPEEPQTKHKRHTDEDRRTDTRKEPNYHVIIWNDEEHTYEYVIDLLMTIFGHNPEKAFQITKEVDMSGKGIAFTTHRELAELKCEQVLSFGADPRMPRVSKGSIKATVEPAEPGVRG